VERGGKEGRARASTEKKKTSECHDGHVSHKTKPTRPEKKSHTGERLSKKKRGRTLNTKLSITRTKTMIKSQEEHDQGAWGRKFAEKEEEQANPSARHSLESGSCIHRKEKAAGQKRRENRRSCTKGVREKKRKRLVAFIQTYGNGARESCQSHSA